MRQQVVAPATNGAPGAQGIGRTERADAVARRVLFIRSDTPRVARAQAQRAFSFAMALSGLRCILTYVIAPFVLPILGSTVRVRPMVGVPLGLIALYFDVRGLRRFWLSSNPRRWAFTAVYLAVMILVVVLLARDLASL